MIIETPRLILREMEDSDFVALKKVLGDPENMIYYRHQFSDEIIQKWIARNIENYKIFGFGLLTIVLKETGATIGDAGLTMQIINHKIKPEIGYHILKSQHKRGYAKEAAIAIRDWVFNNTSFQTIYSYMTYDNIASYKTAIACGMREVETFIDEKDDNTLTKVCAITKDEWKNLNVNH